MGSLSRILSVPGLRISYMVLPTSLLSLFIKEKQFTVNLNTISGITILNDFIQQGHLELAISKWPRKAFYKHERDRLINAEDRSPSPTRQRLMQVSTHLIISSFTLIAATSLSSPAFSSAGKAFIEL